MLFSLAIVPTAAGAVLMLLSNRGRLLLGMAASAVLALTLMLALLAAGRGWTGDLAWGPALALTTRLTPLSALVAALVPAIALPILAYAAAHEERTGLARLIGLLLVFAGGMELLVVADDLLTLLIGWEIVGACSWALIGHRWRDGANPASGLYAFVMTRAGDLGLFLAAMAAFAGTGSFAFDGLAGLEAPLAQIVAFGLLVSAASKSGQLPFAPWLFRAMDGPTSASALLHAAAMVAAGAYLLARLHPVLSGVEGFAGAAVAIGLATALMGGLVALVQNHAKKLLAASTSAHFGLMFVAVGAGYPGVAILHLTAHAAFKALLFLAAGVAHRRAGSFALDRLGLGGALPVVAALAAVGASALAGLPPLGGGWTKEAIVSAAGHHATWAAVGVMIAGGLSAAYAARFQVQAYGRKEEPPAGPNPTRADRAGLAWLALLTLALSVLWLPAAGERTGDWLGAAMPAFKRWELVGSLLLLALGLAVGLLVARRHPRLGADGAGAAFADWMGLPTLIRVAVGRPFTWAAHAAARLDDRLLDAGPRAAASAASALARVLVRRDRRTIDRGVEIAAGFAARLAGVGDRIGERIADGLPEGAARIVGMGGADARRLQSGLAHHYFALLAFGTAVLIAILIVGA